jgi:hypothetical protein
VRQPPYGVNLLAKLVSIIFKVRIDKPLSLWGEANYSVGWYLAKKQVLEATTCLNIMNKSEIGKSETMINKHNKHEQGNFVQAHHLNSIDYLPLFKYIFYRRVLSTCPTPFLQKSKSSMDKFLFTMLFYKKIIITICEGREVWI